MHERELMALNADVCFTYNADGRNPLFDQQQDVAKLKIP